MSEAFSAAEVAEWCGGVLVQGEADARFEGISIDTRKLAKADLFVAIRGPNHDSHDYLGQAIAAGVGGLLIDSRRRDRVPEDAVLPVISVPDSTRGLGDLAAGHRSRFHGPVVALTGSSGKTTTKEMCASVLGVSRPCLKTEGNLNNEFGLPLTLMRREPEHAVLVVELGMNHRGEIARLAEIAQPNVAVITNIGTAHIEFLGSIEEIAAEKGDLFAAIQPDGIAVANWDDANVAAQSERCPGSELRYGVAAQAQVRAEKVRFVDEGAFEFELILPEASTPVRVEGLGETTIINALAAAAVGVACGSSADEIRTGLEHYSPIAGRMTRHSLARGITLIDDSYNANPQSMGAALESLSRLKGKARGIAVLGAMGELGDEAEAAHAAAGRKAAELGIDDLVVVGEAARSIVAGAARVASNPDRIHHFEGHGDAAEFLREIMEPGSWILVKGSRAARMERIVEALSDGDSN